MKFRKGAFSSSSVDSMYESKLEQTLSQFDFHSYFTPLTEAINSYLKCIRQYPSLHNQLSNADPSSINDLISYILFQISLVNYVSSTRIGATKTTNKSSLVNWQILSQSFLCVFNLLVDHLLLEHLCQRANYAALVSHLVDNFYHLIVRCFFR